jgi:cobyrinic acid a,c-diamide synthase
MSGRGLILAAPASGSGKTLVTLGLLRHLRQRGVRVAAAKAGPDYIDPGYLAAASGRECVNLDVWAMRPRRLAGLVRCLEASAELVVCEGVMGLFDGTGASGEAGSTAELAQITGWPIVLVVDASRQGASAAALVRGFCGHDPLLPLAGIIFNRVAGKRHRELLEAAIARHLPALSCYGALALDRHLALPSRHLGLVPATEASGLETVFDRAAAWVGAGLDVAALTVLAQPSRVGSGGAAPGLVPLGRRVAIACDDAFVFTYGALLAEWRSGGSELIPFSPLADEAPDTRADAVYLPGGYPELHAARLAAAATFLSGLRQAAADGKPVYGECGGYMVLGESLTDATRTRHRMAGLLPLATNFAERRLHVGYREATLLGAHAFGPAGTRFRGHEFHYATTESQGKCTALLALHDAAGADLGTSGMRRGSVSGSFVHLIDRMDSRVEPRSFNCC